MRKNIYKLATIAFATVFLHSCSVDDYKVEGELTEETLIQNETSAQSALNGIYDSARPDESKGVFSTVNGLMMAGIEQQASGSTLPTLRNFYTNDVKLSSADGEGDNLRTFYVKSYKTINLVNHFIKIVNKKPVPGLSENAKNSMIAQAKTLRANSYFMLLKVFGQFYDSNSEYGVITTDKIIDGFTHLKRAKVSETYAQIISDLEFAINHAPNKGRDEVSKTFAKGLLAKVYLYKGGTENWAKTVTYCKDIINNLGANSGFELVPSYSSIFEKSFNSKEVIFAPYYSKDEPLAQMFLSFGEEYLKPTKYFKDLAKDDPRYEFTFVKKMEKNTSFAYNKYPSVTKSTFYFLRVAEVYLIYAEALARTNGNTQVAIQALNTVRKRAGVPEKNYTDKATLLEDIRKEKMLELHLETAETWFDLVRYDRLGNLKIGDLKSTITNVNQLIFPIPVKAIVNNPNFGSQNPGY